jgi:hypothetical protein
MAPDGSQISVIPELRFNRVERYTKQLFARQIERLHMARPLAVPRLAYQHRKVRLGPIWRAIKRRVESFLYLRLGSNVRSLPPVGDRAGRHVQVPGE